jgi:hypothetical protein
MDSEKLSPLLENSYRISLKLLVVRAVSWLHCMVGCAIATKIVACYRKMIILIRHLHEIQSQLVYALSTRVSSYVQAQNVNKHDRDHKGFS